MKELSISAVNNMGDLTPKNRSLESIFKAIQSGVIEEQIKHLRSLTDKFDISKYKESLPAILFSGIFKGGKKDQNLETHSGLTVLDYDNLENYEEKKTEIISNPFVLAAFKSPSGKGLKVVIRIFPNKFTHYYQYASLIKLFPGIDKTSRSISRLTYMSSDPDIYINWDALVFEGFEDGKEKDIIPSSTALKTNYTLLGTAVAMIRNARDGQKHAELLKASKLIGGYVAGGLVEEEEAIRILEREINKKKISDPAQALKTIQDGIEYGKKQPLSLQTKENSKVRIDSIIKSDKVIQENDDYSFVADKGAILEYLSNVKNNTFDLGLGIGIPEFDDYVRFKKQTITVVNGHDNVGKSNMLWYYFTLLALKQNLSFIIFSAENKSGGVVRKIIEYKYCRHLNELSDNELLEAYEWVENHFTILNNEDSYTYKDILARSAKLLSKKKYDAVLFDPYNALYRDMEKNRNTHEYDYDVLGDMRLFAKHFDCSVYINCHIVTEASRKLHPDKHEYAGMLMPPQKSDTEGGSKFANRADDFWTVHRYTQHPTDWNITYIHVRKIRETETGGKPTSFNNPIKLYNQFGIAFTTENNTNPVISTAEEAKKHNIQFKNNNNFNDF